MMAGRIDFIVGQFSLYANGQKLKSGKTLKVDRAGKTKAGTKSVVIFQCVRKSGKCIAYGPSVQVKCSLKAAR